MSDPSIKTELKNHGSAESVLGEVLDQYLRELADGQQPDIEAYAAEHPEIASLIREALPVLKVVNDSLSERGSRGDTDLSRSKQLGDFKLLHELGAGGMGFVYEAEQLSMGRRVALKILPMAGALQDKQRQRFRNEVRAAAMLDHPNIVSVYSVGEDRGVHYYAMQLIRGQSLAEVIAELRTLRADNQSLDGESIQQSVSSADNGRSGSDAFAPTEQLTTASNDAGSARTVESVRNSASAASETSPALHAQLSTKPQSNTDRGYFASVARLGIQAAEGLQHAHDAGILHRDIKPGNLMLDADAQLHITDFGLARIDTDVGLTMTGDIVGTLRYMSPEQALAKRVVVDHRSDVYSLGATLYELLTLEPAFGSDDRQELLRQIAFQEPRSPRRINAAIPTDLETIVLKALAKNPDERYATAQELADDLQRYLDHVPIRAKRPSLLQLSGKWAQRNKTLVRTAAATVAIATLIGGWLLWNEQRETLAALARVTQAQAEEQQQRIEAQRQRQLAETNFRRAREAVDTFLTSVSENQLFAQPSMQPLRQELLTLAVNYHQQFVAEQGDAPEVQADVARAYERLAEINTLMNGISEEALAWTQQANAVWKELALHHPEDPQIQISFANNLVDLGDQRLRVGGISPYEQFKQQVRADSSANFKQAIEIASALSKPEYRETLSRAYRSLAGVHQSLEYYSEASAILEELIEQFADRRDLSKRLGDVHHSYGSLLEQFKVPEEASEQYQRGLEIRKQLVAADPENIEYQLDLIQSYIALRQNQEGLRLAEKIPNDSGRNDLRRRLLHQVSALGENERAVAIGKALVKDNPTVLLYRRDLADAQRALGGTYRYDGKLTQAIAAFRASISNWEDVVADNPAYMPGLAETMYALMRLQLDSGMTQEGIESGQAIVDMDGAAFPIVANANARLAGLYGMRGDFLSHITAVRGVIEANEVMMGGDSTAWHPNIKLGSTWIANLGNSYRLKGDTKSSLAAYQDCISMTEKSFAKADPTHLGGGDFSSAKETLDCLKGAYQSAGVCLVKLDRHQEAAALSRRAIDSLIENGRRHTTWVPLLDCERYIDLHVQISKESEIESTLRGYLSETSEFPEEVEERKARRLQQLELQLQLANWLRRQNRYEEAERYFSDATASLESIVREATGSPEMSDNQKVTMVNAVTNSVRLCRVLQLVDQSDASGQARFVQTIDKHLPRAIELVRGVDFSIWKDLTIAFYRPRGWQGSEAEARRAIEMASNQPLGAWLLAPLLVLAGEREEYRKYCGPLMKNWDRLEHNEMSLTAYLMLADPEVDLTQVRRIVSRLEEARSQFGVFADFLEPQLFAGYLRLGRHEEALAGLLAHVDCATRPYIQMHVAMNYELIGNHKEAVSWLAKAEKLATDWRDTSSSQALVEIVRAEAHRLIGNPTEDEPDQRTSTESRGGHEDDAIVGS